MKNVNVVSKPKLYVISNGDIDFPVSFILCRYWKMNKTAPRSWAYIQPAVSAYSTKLMGKLSVQLKRA
jgi:hypothetical protein